eukprot:135532_1
MYGKCTQSETDSESEMQLSDKIEINLEAMNQHREGEKRSSFGYKLLKPLFFIPNSETINYSKVLQIFKRKLKKIVIYNIYAVRQGWLKSVHLNALFCKEILKG